jgi:hypothetical protein
MASSMSRRGHLAQPARLAIAIGYFAALLLLSQFVHGQPLPPFGLDGLWFYAAFAALVLGQLLLEPYFATPANAIANGVALLFAVVSTSLEQASVAGEVAAVGRTALTAYAGAVIGLGLVAVGFKDRADRWAVLASAASAALRSIGGARLVFSILLFAAAYAAFADDVASLATLYLSWFAITVGRPLERIATWFVDRAPAHPRGNQLIVDGVVDPGIMLARASPNSHVALGAYVADADGRTIGQVVDTTILAEQPRIRIAMTSGRTVPIGIRLSILDDAASDVIGHVGEGTTLEELHVRTVSMAADIGLSEGRLLAVSIGGHETLFQVTGAETFRRLEEDIGRDLIRVVARKLGSWDSVERTFKPVPWLPAPGAAVRVLAQRESAMTPDAIGLVPGTDYAVTVDLDHLVTHNSAILGILGVGKTHLAWELIARMLVHGIKVICLDISGRYSGHFSDVCSSATENAIAHQVEGAIRDNQDERAVRDNEAGNLGDFVEVIGKLLRRFLAGEERLLILNPNRYRVTRMKGNPYQGRANNLTDLTMVEITRIIAEQVLAIVQQDDRDPEDDSARVCLVIEEAHSLVPEWNSAASEGDQQAVNGTARALLQGRKYGFGYIAITQRTANVSKSILNQCNTVFGMRAFDATGMGFLENYIGPAYAKLLASLKDRQAVVFGRALTSKAPIIVDLNDASDFAREFWRARSHEVPVTRPELPQEGQSEPEPAPQPGTEPQPEFDDLPF